MATQIEVAQTQKTGGRRRNRNRNQKMRRDEPDSQAPPPTLAGSDGVGSMMAPTNESTISAKDEPVADDGEVCFICAENVKYYSVSECNNRTCHVCSLRLRALYKKKECTFCNLEHSHPELIITSSPSALYEDYNLEEMKYKDTKLAILFETQDMMEESLVYLRFNCPEEECVFVAKGWNDLKMHARASHGKLMCDICIRFKKVFAHEHTLYTSAQLRMHVPSMAQRSGKSVPREKRSTTEGDVHPLCEFCQECFFGDDELFKHLREAHEECFICKRQEIRDQYFQNYKSLEEHFNNVHHPCKQADCLAQKFVVFGSIIDLKAHMVDVHGASMSSRDLKDARRVDISFGTERQPPAGRRDGDRVQGHESRRVTSTTNDRPTPTDRRRGAFGTTLSNELTQSQDDPLNSRGPNNEPNDAVGNSETDTIRRHAEFMTRVADLTPNSSSAANAATAIKLVVRSYRASECAAQDLISTIYNLVDRDLEASASLIVPLIDLLDNEEKRRDLLAAYNEFKIEQREEFPDLVPRANNNDTLNGPALKHKVAPRRTRNGQVWERVARAATSTSPGPSKASRPIPRPSPQVSSAAASSSSSNLHQPIFRQPQRSTPWASSAASASSMNRGASQTTARPHAPSPRLSDSAFPSLPKAPVRQKLPAGIQSLRDKAKVNTAQNVWTSGTTSANGAESTIAEEKPVAAPDGGQSKKGKKKGKEKITLFTLGSFPT